MYVRVRTRIRENDVLHAEEVKQVSGVISFGKYKKRGGEGAEGREGVTGDREGGRDGEKTGGKSRREGRCMEMHVFEIKQDL